MKTLLAIVALALVAPLAHAAPCGITVGTDGIDTGCLPALTADRQAVAVPIVDPDGGRGSPNLIVRFMYVSEVKVKNVTVASAEEWNQWADGERADKAKARIAIVDKSLGVGFVKLKQVLAPGQANERTTFRLPIAGYFVSGRDGKLIISKDGGIVVQTAFPSAKGACKAANAAFLHSMYLEGAIAVLRFDHLGNDSCQEPAPQWMAFSLTPAVESPPPPTIAAGKEPNLELYQQELVGTLKLGMSSDDLTAALGKPTKTSRARMQEATGTYVSTWDFAGVSAIVEADKKKGPFKLAALTVRSPSTLTVRGVGIGASAAEVAKAFPKKLWDKESSTPEQIVVGSIYGGILFTFEKKRVVQIFVGAAAE